MSISKLGQGRSKHIYKTKHGSPSTLPKAIYTRVAKLKKCKKVLEAQQGHSDIPTVEL